MRKQEGCPAIGLAPCFVRGPLKFYLYISCERIETFARSLKKSTDLH